MATVLALVLLPFVFFPAAVAFGWSSLSVSLAIAQITAILVIKIILVFRFKGRAPDALFTPISMISIFFIALGSAIGHKKGKGVAWKGRNYSPAGQQHTGNQG